MLLSQFASSQAFDSLSYPYKIHGVISDDSGNSLPGVNVVSPGDGNHQVSNINGEYYAHIYTSKTQVVFSLPDYSMFEYYPDGRLEVNVVLNQARRSWLYKVTRPIRRMLRLRR